MKKINPLNYKYLRQHLDPKKLNFETTDELQPLIEFLGQERALEALKFGMGVKNEGFNIYAMGPSGIGKRSLIHRVLENEAIKQKTPWDWCHIHNFHNPEKPISISLPPGCGSALQQEMKLFIEELSTSILVMLESDEYRKSMHEINNEFNAKKEKLTKKFQKNEKIAQLHKEKHEKEKHLQLQFTSSVIEPLIKKIKDKYEQYENILNYLMNVQNDVISHVNELVKQDEVTNILSFSFNNPALLRYEVNLLVDNEKTTGAPIIFEENPSYSNLIGRMEHVNQYGSPVTSIIHIKPGTLHKANGGYLIIEARKLKKEKHAWEGLKRALFSRKIFIEPVENFTESTKPISLEPLPIPLDIKIILLGDRNTYYHLSNHDPDFTELFKVAVDFDEQIERNEKNILSYARLIGTIVHKEKLKPFHASAVAALIDYSTWLAEDIEKLSTHIRNVDDLILESDYWSSVDNKKIVDSNDVNKAIKAQIHRIDRTRDLYYEEIERNFIIINTQDSIVGQVNCLSVIKAGKFSYGHPTRVTVKVFPGKGKILDIQREIKMAGPMHSKAGLIIANYLASRYSYSFPFSLHASISFEQIYGMMDGDSASVAELCALLSSLSDLPINQFLAITGSIDQEGQVQAVGGINEKIEGFFDICNKRGLTKDQGVIIPQVNTKNLMLREDIVEAAKQKKFFIYPIKTVDEAIFLLMGSPEKNDMDARIEKKLKKFSAIQRNK